MGTTDNQPDWDASRITNCPKINKAGQNIRISDRL